MGLGPCTMSASGDGIVFLAPLRSCIDPSAAAAAPSVQSTGTGTQ
jgi:hypothetical protein